MEDKEFIFESPLSAQQQAWRTKHPDWISDHFYMGEFMYSAVAVERGLENTPTRRHGRRSGIWLKIY